MKDEIQSDFFTKCSKYFHEFEKNYSLWRIIKAMPKTAVLHIHSDVCCKQDWLLKVFKLFPENIYKNKKNNLYYYFEKSPPDDGGNYALVEELKKQSGDEEKFMQSILN